MPALQSVGELSLYQMGGSPDLSWLSGAEVGAIEILDSDVASLSGVTVTALDWLSLARLPDLTDAALSDLTTIGESGAAFVELPALTTLDLPALTTIEGGLLLQDTALQDLSGLSALTSIGGDLQITDNPDLDQQEIDAFLAHVTVAGRVTVE